MPDFSQIVSNILGIFTAENIGGITFIVSLSSAISLFITKTVSAIISYKKSLLEEKSEEVGTALGMYKDLIKNLNKRIEILEEKLVTQHNKINALILEESKCKERAAVQEEQIKHLESEINRLKQAIPLDRE